MKVLIEIDEKVYRHIKEHSGLAYAVEDYLHEVEWAIKNGTPLPKGHGVLKDVNEILSTIRENIENAKRDKTNYCNAFENNGEWCAELWSIEDIIENAPIIIEADKAESEDICG